jgi:hypothetical protein
MKETKNIKERNPRKLNPRKTKRKNERLSLKNKKKYNMTPIYGGVSEEPKKEGLFTKLKNKVKDISNRETQYIDQTNDVNMNVKEKLKNRSAFTNLVSAPLLGLARNTQAVANNLTSKPTDKEISNTPVDISKTIGTAVTSISTGVSNMTKQTMTLSEKTKIKQKLKKLLDKHELRPEEYEHAVQQIDKPDSAFSNTNSIVSIMSPIQSVVKVIGDWFVNANDSDNPDDIQPRRTIIKLLKFPKSSKTFVKGTLGKDGHEIADEFMILTKDVFTTQGEKTDYDLNSVDNLLANVINGCIGPGCKYGRVQQTPVIEKIVKMIDNQNKLAEIKLMQDLKKKQLEDENR